MAHFIKYKQSTVSYQLFGNGPELLLAFPGYGKEAGSLDVLGKHFGSLFTVAAIDVFHHGQSVWNEAQPPTSIDWEVIITQILNTNGNPQKFSVFGYSIGGRVATYTAFLFSKRINTLWLMAATGIGNEGFYKFATGTTVGNALFKRFVRRPGFIFALINRLKEPLHGFIKRKIDTLEKRDLLYKRWRVLKNFTAPAGQLKSRLVSSNARLVLVYGKNDKVVPSHAAAKFAHGIKNATLLLPDAGHYLFDDKTLQWVLCEAFTLK